MKRYFVNLWLALLGGDPYRDELDEMRRRQERAEIQIRDLHELYYGALEKWTVARKESAGLERLVESLRGRIADKDDMLRTAGREFKERMERMKADYQHRIDEYNMTIDELHKLIPKRHD